MNVGDDTWQLFGICAENGVIDISGSVKVTVDFINGGAESVSFANRIWLNKTSSFNKSKNRR
jgi:hypothetical protein